MLMGNLTFLFFFNSVCSLLPRPLMNHDRLQVYLHLSWHSLLPWRVFLSGRPRKHILEVVNIFTRKSLFQHFNQGEQVMVFVYAILVGVAVTVSAVLKVASKASKMLLRWLLQREVTSQRLKQLRQAARLFVPSSGKRRCGDACLLLSFTETRMELQFFSCWISRWH